VRDKRGISAGDTLRAIGFLPLCNPRAGLGTGFEYLRLLRSQWWSRDEIEKYQGEKLEHLVDQAVATVPHYSGLGLQKKPTGLGAREFLTSWPILTKEDIRACPERTHSNSASRGLIFKATTGGTTGDPIEVWKNQGALAVCEAALWRGKAWLEIKPWDRGIHAYGFGGGSWYGKLRVRMTRKWGVEAFNTSEETRKAFIDLLRRTRPVYIEGFITDLLRLGEVQECSRYGIRQVITTAEMLYEGQRERLEKYYGARVSDYYGSNEVNSIAFECEEGTKHVTDEHVILETVDDAGRPVWDAPGRILVTDLDNHAMPLIRYALGDTGVLTSKPCACGRKLAVLKTLLGRTQDALRNESGEKLSAVFFAGKFKEIKKIRRFQLIQKSLREVELAYEMAEPGVEPELAAIVSEIKNRLGPQMAVRVQQVENLPRTEVGKCRLVAGLPEEKPLG